MESDLLKFHSDGSDPLTGSSEDRRGPFGPEKIDLPIRKGWTRVDMSVPSRWHDALLASDAHYRQYPYWCKPYETDGSLKPHFYAYNTSLGEAAYVCILEWRIAWFKVGLLFRGPVSLGSEPLGNETIHELLVFAKENGYAFLRFTNRDENLTQRLLTFPNSRNFESFPYYRDPPGSLIVTQAETDAATLASFQAVARRNIRAAEKAGYDISKSESPEDYRRIWPMFERLAGTKGFELTNRTLHAWLEVVEAASAHGCSHLYMASLDGVCVSAIHLLRYGQMSEFMLGALDLELLGKSPSPSALLHWTAMRDAYRAGCKYYNLGGPGDGVRNKVFQFKSKFRPSLREAEPPVTIILKPFAYRCWEILVLKGWIGFRRQIRRVKGKTSQLIWGSLQKINRLT